MPKYRLDVKEVTRALIEKVFSSAKPSIKKMGQEVSYFLFEKLSKPDLMEAILLSLKSKNMKTVVSAI